MYRIGIPKEIKAFETRVSLIPEDIKSLLDNNSDIFVYVQRNAGHRAGYSDEDYIACGAVILANIEDVYEKSNIIVKVKEPQSSEYPLITSKHTVLSFFHFAGNNELINAMINSKAKCYAYETIQDDNGVYPILTPMSIIAGKNSMIEADKLLINKNKYTIITIIGVGNVGKAAAEQAIKLGYKNTNIYCVPNIPSLEPNEASIKLSNAIYPYLDSLLSINSNTKHLHELNRSLYVNKGLYVKRSIY